MDLNESDLQIIEEFLANQKVNIFRFLMGKQKIHQRFHELLQKVSNIQNNLYEKTYMLIIIILYLIELIISNVQYYNPSHLLLDSLVFIVIVTLFTLSLLKKTSKCKQLKIIIPWVIYMSFLVEIIVWCLGFSVKISEKTSSEKKEAFIKVRNHKIFFMIISGHLVMPLFIQINMSMHFVHVFIPFILDLFLIFTMNIFSKEFIFEAVTLVCIDAFIFILDIKTESINFNFFKLYIKEKSLNFENDNMIHATKIGRVTCKMNFNKTSSNSNFLIEISSENDIFKSHMNDLTTVCNESCQRKPLLFFNSFNQNIHKDNINTNTTSKLNENEEDEHQEDIVFPNGSFTGANSFGELVRDNKDSILKKNGTSKSQGKPGIRIEIEQKGKKFILCKNIIQKYSLRQKSPFDKERQIEKTESVKDLSEALLEEFNCFNNFTTSYNLLGLFKVKSTKAYYKIYFCVKKFDMEKKSVELELLFEEVMNHLSEYKKRIETVYQNLIMSKISNEFKEGITTIINLISSIKNQNDQPSKSFVSHYSQTRTFTINSETLMKLSVLSECILIIIADLTEYVKIKTNVFQISSQDSNKSYYSLSDFKVFLDESCNFYLTLFRKNVTIKIDMEQGLFNTQILTNELKLKQIVSNIISNAIKQTPNHKEIFVQIKDLYNNNNLLTVAFTNPSTKNTIQQNKTFTSQNLMNYCPKDQRRGKSFFKNSSNNSMGMVNAKTETKVKLIIIIDDQGKGIENNLLTNINGENKSFLNDATKNVDLISNANFSIDHNENIDYSKLKGLGTGLKIVKKLSKEIDMIATCEHITSLDASRDHKNINNQTSTLGTRFILELVTDAKKYSFSGFRSTKVMDSILTSVNCPPLKLTENLKKKVFYEDTQISEIVLFEPGEQRLSISEMGKSDYDVNMISRNYDGNDTSYVNYQAQKFFAKIAKRETRRKVLSPQLTNHKCSSSRGAEQLHNGIKNTLSFEIKQQGMTKLKKVDGKRRNSLLSIQSKKSNLMPSQIKVEITQNSPTSSESSLCDDEDLSSSKILVVDDSITHQSNIEMLIKRFFRKKNAKCNIIKLEDGAQLLYELYKEISKGELQTKFIFCDEQMLFLNGSQCFDILQKSQAKLQIGFGVPFVLCSADASSLRADLKKKGLEYVYDKPLSNGDIEFIFTSKMINNVKNPIVF